MAEDSREEPDEEFREMLRAFLAGNTDLDPSKLASAAGLPNDPELVAQLIAQLQSAMQSSGDGINWGLALDQAKSLASRSTVVSLPAERSQIEQAFHVASLWLAEATDISELTSQPRLMSRTEWVTETMPVWIQLSEPVATSIADSLTSVLRDQAPEEMTDMIAGASQLMRNVGGTLFAMQLGQVVGQLSSEVVSGGDIGIPLLGAISASEHGESDQFAAMIPQNVAAFATGLDVPVDQVQLYLAVRELAHARLFRHAKWLRLQLMTSITEFAHGIRIDTDRLEELASDFDPSNPEELRAAMTSGALIPPKSEEQLAALGRLETMLALIEGWVDVVTAQATSRLPSSVAIAETVRRRRASGGPAESAFSTLVGLELRPRRLREAAAMWQAVSDAVGAEARDALWSHPDLVPTAEDITDPTALVARLTAGTPAPDDIDQAIEDLLNDDTSERPTEQ
ncbi:putative hydrolase [Conyzicola lurida]|uniref:Putative hydrolase n=1 Tax=Conyzicola lurida TaxID=1172621 RepID=A0A841AL87_9MICO|nr:zinc-dependent metalloprotease [Conyzicola lurida]MBB5842481.1 putative hydrolase [Conyzicola lurida]